MNDKYFKVAIIEAEKAYKKGEVPVGAVIVNNNKIISKAHNQVEKKNNCLCHAELLAISKASKKIKNWRLLDCDLYVTLEPCDMCKKAISASRIKNVYYISTSNYELKSKVKYHQSSNDFNYIEDLLQKFFKKLR